MERYRGWLILNSLPDLGRARIGALVRRFGSPEAALDASDAALLDVEGIGRMAAESIRNWRSLVDVDAELRLVEKHGVSLTSILDDDYPENLRRTAAPPPLLYYRGTLEEIDEAALAVIGTRKMSLYGREAAHSIATELARAGVTIVSGLAIGIDSVAHKAALEAGGRTLAVLGSGLARIYPAQHKSLAEEVAESGALLSEASMASLPDAGSFPQRNSIIAGLSLGVLVVEAAARSGTSITVGYALEENRTIFAVPGDITRVNSVGTNRLIQDGALLTTSARDILVELREEFGRLLDNMPKSGETLEEGPPPLPKDLKPIEQAVYEALEFDPLGIDELSETLAEKSDSGESEPVAMGDLMSALLTLEIRGLVRQEPGKRFRRLR